MNIHILGICGTFMGGLAALASEMKAKVSGSDQNIYPPMSTQLDNLGIKLHSGYDEAQLANIRPDTIVVGNVMRRGYPVIEYILDQNIPMLSGPEWLAKNVLAHKHVLAVSGTHGKTTTSSMLAWILECAGLNPGFLIGGVAENFGISARLGGGKYFVIEADEYDSAFFDKRSKFIHYRPSTLIINNLEYDHADIFPDLKAIQTQFHHLIRTIPQSGLIVMPYGDANIQEVIDKGCWTPITSISEKVTENSHWSINNASNAYNAFSVLLKGQKVGEINWSLIGKHNMFNGLSAIAAAHHVGVNPMVATQALNRFKGVKRRLELKATKNGIQIYDDFAHHPTAIQTTLAGLRAMVGNARIFAVIELRSNTMRLGTHEEALAKSFHLADNVFFFKAPDMTWDVEKMYQKIEKPGGVYQTVESLMASLQQELRAGDKLIFMSNGGFGGIPDKVHEIL